jgi:3-oxoacyl-[acyl-carrier-protein] synthase-3
MATARFTLPRITAVAATTGPVTRTLDDDAHLFGENPVLLERMRTAVGVHRRHIAPRGVTTLDLCEDAARRLLAESCTAAADLDAVLCVTQTPDHWQPCNANIFHGRLGLPKSVLAFDVNQGCSGWVYGLYLSYCMVQAGGCRRVLLLAGDTVTQTIHPEDRSVVPLFGDAGTATLVEAGEAPSPSCFALHSDGQGHAAIKIPAGAHRQPADASTKCAVRDGEGNVRSPENLFMHGLEVFNFTLREEPKAVKKLLELSGDTVESIDAFVFHQANRFILANLARRIGAPDAKVPWVTAEQFGNQSSASIPAALCHALGNRLLAGRLRLLCSGFGVGLSWASSVLEAGPLRVCSIRQYVQSSSGSIRPS